MRKLLKLFNSLTEIPRGMTEWGALALAWPDLKKQTPDGDGHPVLILPGFLTTDTYTAPLRNCIAEKGYKAYTWGGGVNTGLSEASAEHLRSHLEKIFAENGGRKITLVGHSLGGIYARELAREYPDMVRAVITLGTPFGAGVKPDAASEPLRRIYRLFNSGNINIEDPALARRGLTPPPVPTTSIYSKSDGLVDWEASVNPAEPGAESIEVSSSHLGMIVHPPAVAAVLDRLAQPEGAWKPFDKKAYEKHSFGDGPANDDVPQNPKFPHAQAKSEPLFRKKK